MSTATVYATADRRGPAGTELMGVSIALQHQDVADWDQDGWANAVQYYQPQLLDMLRTHVGGARFQTEPQVHVEGPHSDPIQGTIYVMTVAAWFSPLDLSVDCSAYKARSSRSGA